MAVEITNGFLILHRLTSHTPEVLVKGSAIMCVMDLGQSGSQITIGTGQTTFDVIENCGQILEAITASYKGVLKR